MKERLCVPMIVALWTLAVTLMSVSLASDGEDDLGRAAILVGLMACVPTGFRIVEHVADHASRRIIYTVAELVGRESRDDSGSVSRMRR